MKAFLGNERGDLIGLRGDWGRGGGMKERDFETEFIAPGGYTNCSFGSCLSFLSLLLLLIVLCSGTMIGGALGEGETARGETERGETGRG